MSTRQASDNQEKYIAKITDGKVTPNSGGTKFSGGDVIIDDTILVEAKTTMSPKESFSVKKDWIDKSKAQAFQLGLNESVVAFQFEQNTENYFVLDESQFLDYIYYKYRREEN